jgi:hypothetical protein
MLNINILHFIKILFAELRKKKSFFFAYNKIIIIFEAKFSLKKKL